MNDTKCPPRALTIAGSDSGGGAGIQADLKTFQAFGCFGMSAVTALTAQNSTGVQGVFKIPAEFVARQIDSVLGDIGADAVKCGMLADSGIIEAVAAALERGGCPPLVLDTVLLAKSGDPLLEDRSVETMARRLFPLAALVTPNIPEAERLTGRKIEGCQDMFEAAEQIRTMGARAVLLKGGHLTGACLVDILLLPDGSAVRYESERIDTRHTHGTGCTLSAAVAAGLARGLELAPAVEAARCYVLRGIRLAHATGAGYGTLRHAPFDPETD